MLYAKEALLHVETMTLYFINVSMEGIVYVFLERNVYEPRSGGMVMGSRKAALHLNMSSGVSVRARRHARRSAALLLGAQARIFARGYLMRIWLMDSMIVTVFPVPGLWS